MISVSVSELQRKMNKVIMPCINAGEEIQVIDKKSGEVKFHIVPPVQDDESADWSNLDERLIDLGTKRGYDPFDKALNDASSDKDFQ